MSHSIINILHQIKGLFVSDDLLGRSEIVKKNILYSLIIRFASIAVSLLLVPLTIGYVSAELYGVWLTLSSIMTWLSFMDIGFTQGLKNKLAEAIALEDWNRGKQLVSTTYWMMLVIFVPVCIALQFAIPLVDWCNLLNVNSIYEKDILQVMSVVIGFACLNMIVNVLVSVVAAFQKVALSNSFTVIGNIVSLFIIIILTKTVPPSLLYLSVTFCTIPVVVTVVASLILFKGKFKNVAPSIHCINRHLVKDLFGLGYKFFIINIQVLVLYQSTNVLISNVSSPLMVTSYNLAYKYLNLAMMLFNIITAPLWPAYTDAYTKGDYDWMKNTRKKMSKVLLLSIAACAFMVAVSPLFYKVWIGDRADVPFTMTVTVAIYVAIFCWANLNGTIIVGMSKITLNTYMVWIGMFGHIPLSLFLSSKIGAYGVLVSMILINTLYAIVFHIQTNMLLNREAKGIWNK